MKACERNLQILLLFSIAFFLILILRMDLNCGRISVVKKKLARKYLTADVSRARFANNIFEFCSVYGISKFLDRQPVVYLEDVKLIEIVENLKSVMPKLMNKFEYRRVPVERQNLTSIRQIEFNQKCCIFDNPQRLKSLEEETIHLKGAFYQSYKYFNEYRNEIRDSVSRDGDFGSLPASEEDKRFIMCIHIRRTDFVDGQHHASDEHFIRAARSFIEKRENQSNMTIVLLGDDIPFARTIFENETNIFISENSPKDDLIYSRSNCDATLISAPSSTFGWWISYLSKGERVYYLDIKTTNDVVYTSGQLETSDFFDPRWTALKFDRNLNRVELSDD